MILDNLSTYPFVIIDNDYKVFQVPNIKKCMHPPGTSTSFWDIEQYKEEITEPANYFFIFEAGITWSFGHWIFESAIYLPLFNKLKKLYPTIKLIYNLERDYKSLFFDIFSITSEDIILNLSPLETHINGVTCDNLPPNNICFLPSPISAINGAPIYPVYRKHIENFISFFDEIDIPNSHDNKWLIIPRGQKQICPVNIRNIPFDKIFTYFNTNAIEYSTINTDTLENLRERISYLRNSENIVLCDGSAYLVNMLFCKNKNFITASAVTDHDRKFLVRLDFLIKVIVEINQHQTILSNDVDECIQKINYIHKST
jgi:hypothetical protein